MTRVHVEVHKGIAEVLRLDPGVEVILTDLDVGSVVRYCRKGRHIDWRIVNDIEAEQPAEPVVHE